MRTSVFHPYPQRHALLLWAVMVTLGLLASRAIFLVMWNKDFLQGQGDARAQRVLTTPAGRGMITDRNGEHLAISTPVASVWVNPQTLLEERSSWPRLMPLLGLKPEPLHNLLAKHKGSEFVYLKRHVAPEVAQQVTALKIPGVFLQREYRRFYPAAEVTAHIIGFTNLDDVGQEGLELVFEPQLRGEPGSQRVIKDRRGSVVEGLRRVRDPRPGRHLTLSLDMRLQYLAYRELKAAVRKHKAQAGSLVMLDARTGEVLAMVNQPAYNPNSRHRASGAEYRNRAVTDLFEPGSTIKPFTVACALESGRYRPDTLVDTRPGTFRVAGKTIRDVHPQGLIDVATVIKKSSNVGVSRIALSLPPERLWGMLVRVGFGEMTGSGFPGERPGMLRAFQGWRTVDHATLSYGYGLSVTPLQLARAYAVLAAGGKRREVSFLRVGEAPPGEQVLSPETAARVLAMLEGVVQEGGTGTRARVPGYRVAGKTGTIHRLGEAGRYQNDYISVFAGIAPVSHPKIVAVVTIDHPGAGGHFGGDVAAPVFGRIIGETLRLLNIPPDDPPLQQVALQVDPS
jgi:cell division protein FtsI (penicillin-binding protein 3)